jgi:hypothetical protein
MAVEAANIIGVSTTLLSTSVVTTLNGLQEKLASNVKEVKMEWMDEGYLEGQLTITDTSRIYPGQPDYYWPPPQPVL